MDESGLDSKVYESTRVKLEDLSVSLLEAKNDGVAAFALMAKEKFK